MKIDAIYSFNNGNSVIKESYSNELNEILSAIKSIDASKFKTKISKEKTSLGKMLYSPVALNKELKKILNPLGWKELKHEAIYSSDNPDISDTLAHREMDFVKNEVGVEVQFGKYAFMAYDICSKMPIFKNKGYIEVGIEIVPMKAFAKYMSTGVSYYEQITWDLENRGVSNLDIPVIVIGIDAD
ncbi:Restriction endonuclease BglII [Exiguobacterium sibiricum 255-15]|uniref:Restriction endonuclease BglII n=1 Tax=Exiguobacterium sibiricum (strain DSM 17290 / CCUG 55495 / CIP 109462 / JCM 13490 / 255-15) TaxID=262543 RepID=B1YL25_EXIS2|nr:BglII/BstYI family type II restriction endonuclease [Exiguobacterium sibiricum]ACB61827.1 Restriction endonuclease BglII [Exiguobacterium sibiricum 255-15]